MAKSKYTYLPGETQAKFKNVSFVARSVVEGAFTGLHKSPFHGFSVEFSEHREYVPGDNIKYLDWQALARTDRYYIKQFEDETNLRAYILLDVSRSMIYPVEGGMQKLVYGCYLAGALSYLMVRQQDSVGLVTFDRKIQTRIPPHSTMTHLHEILRTLEKIQPGERTHIADTFHVLAESIRKRGLIIIISDLYDDPAEVVRALKHFRSKRHEVILFHLFHPTELEFPYDRLTDFVDLETEERIQADPVYIRERYLAGIREMTDMFSRECRDGMMDYLVTKTSIPFDAMLSAYLDKRKRIRR